MSPFLLIQLDRGYLDWKAFISTFAHSPHLSFGNPLGMVYEFYEIVLSQMILQMVLMSFLKYVGSLLMLMFPHMYCVYF
jgi:hypothetical protein